MGWMRGPAYLVSSAGRAEASYLRTIGIRLVRLYHRDRWLNTSSKVRSDALQRLLSGPRAQHIPVEAPWRANYFSARYLGGFRLTALKQAV